MKKSILTLISLSAFFVMILLSRDCKAQVFFDCTTTVTFEEPTPLKTLHSGGPNVDTVVTADGTYYAKNKSGGNKLAGFYYSIFAALQLNSAVYRGQGATGHTTARIYINGETWMESLSATASNSNGPAGTYFATGDAYFDEDKTGEGDSKSISTNF